MMSLQSSAVDSSEMTEEFIGFDSNAFTDNAHVIVSLFLAVFSMAFLGSLLGQHLLHKYHFIPEPVITIAVGVIVSSTVQGILKLSDVEFTDGGRNALQIMSFNNEIFFFGFVPPIIFCSGYHLKRNLFFSNFGAITSLAVLGTFISAVFIACGLYFLGKTPYLSLQLSFMECLSFGGLISSTDPVSTLSLFQKLKVDNGLFYLVLGESLLNDAIGIAIFKTATLYIGREFTYIDILIFVLDFCICCVGSCTIGYGTGLLSAWMFKKIDSSTDKLVLLSLFLGSVYLPFFISEMLQLSGIITILFTAITARKFTNKNLSAQIKKDASLVFKLLSFLAETSCFLFLGFSVVTQEMSNFVPSAVGWALLLCFIGRALNVYPLLLFVNLFRMASNSIVLYKQASHDTNENTNSSIEDPVPTASTYTNKLAIASIVPWNIQHMVWFAGMRGIVSYSCANIFSNQRGNQEKVLAMTTAIALITLIVQGVSTTTVMSFLSIPIGLSDDDHHHQENKNKSLSTSPLLSPNRIRVKSARDFERKFIYPLVVKKYEDLSLEIEMSSGGGSFAEDSSISKTTIHHPIHYSPGLNHHYDCNHMSPTSRYGVTRTTSSPIVPTFILPSLVRKRITVIDNIEQDEHTILRLQPEDEYDLNKYNSEISMEENKLNNNIELERNSFDYRDTGLSISEDFVMGDMSATAPLLKHM